MPVSWPSSPARVTLVSTSGPAEGGAKDAARNSLILPSTRSSRWSAGLLIFAPWYVASKRPLR